MDTDNADDLEPTIFSATLTPHRSLGRVGFLILMLLFGAISFVTGMMFLVVFFRDSYFEEILRNLADLIGEI